MADRYRLEGIDLLQVLLQATAAKHGIPGERFARDLARGAKLLIDGRPLLITSVFELELPSAEPTGWRKTLGLGWGPVTAPQINDAYRRLAKSAHPDAGGSVDAMLEINAAREAALREVSR